MPPQTLISKNVELSMSICITQFPQKLTIPLISTPKIIFILQNTNCIKSIIKNPACCPSIKCAVLLIYNSKIKGISGKIWKHNSWNYS